ncbi:transglycosylase SLT domain-containing protein [Limimaricola hongkongensis]|uniref:Soluble lytic murein transglycosylase n=1 Tax=Limimaricola hongkongensis DSM 17492 TaxID=1122180 RepID=A0A017HHU0_9RHOB|nr:transglycosylase SLT domain-containing protein [Limimaricola hongkongensis]EYD73364.1 Soluble lytic murein transglycosylase precursor [Limimaricola hongkongensis DSM 17492]
MTTSTRFSTALAAVLALGLPALPAKAGIEQALDAAARQDWAEARALAAPLGAVALDLVAWEKLQAGDGDWQEYVAFVAAHSDWPRLDRVRAEGERDMPKGLPPEQVMAWFGDTTPETGEGAVRLAEALMAQGRVDAAREMLVDSWLTLGLDGTGHAAMVDAFGDILAPHHAARVDAMLWRWRITDAQRLFDTLSADERRVAEARVALIRDNRAAQALGRVPDRLRDTPGLANARFNRFADKGDYTEALQIIERHTGSAESLGEPFRWASWRASLARWLMREGEPERAYKLASRHFLTEGSFYADLEWLSGYLALTYLDDPARALAHFKKLEGDVESPISLARAGYWQGRAREASGAYDQAALDYARAALHQTAFYGLLSAEKLGLSLDPALTGHESVADWRQGDFLKDDRTQAVTYLLDAGEYRDALRFVIELGRTLDREGLAQLGRMLMERDETHLALTLGKAAAYRQIVIPEIYFPLHALAETEMPVAPELAMSIARRESEFNIGVGSPVGALGLMQLMPATAEEVSGWLGLPYSRAKLTTDWRYNARLGSRYLQYLEETFGQSPVMISAGYNAGASRPRTWMAERGDPRIGQADVVDWIEHIPFTETRNYVMRVSESIPVYRARLTGETGPVRFSDLLDGRPPFVRPRARSGETVLAETAPAPVPPAVDVTPEGRASSMSLSILAPMSIGGMRPPQRPVD